MQTNYTITLKFDTLVYFCYTIYVEHLDYKLRFTYDRRQRNQAVHMHPSVICTHRHIYWSWVVESNISDLMDRALDKRDVYAPTAIVPEPK